jgi:chromosomal replication initiation ATPase DnaA
MNEAIKNKRGKQLLLTPPIEIEKAIIIRKAAAHEFGISEVDIQSSCRKQYICPARQIAIYLTKKLTMLTLKKIGEMYNNRDHTTVIHSCDTAQDRIDTDQYFKQRVEAIELAAKEAIKKKQVEIAL